MAVVLLGLLLLTSAAAQIRHYDITPVDPTDRMSAAETLTISEKGRKFESVMIWRNPAGSETRQELVQEFDADGLTRQLLLTFWIDAKKATVKMMFRHNKPDKAELIDVNGQKSSEVFGPSTDDITSATALGLDFSVVSFQIALNRALKSKLPAAVDLIMLPTGAQAGISHFKVETVGEPRTVAIQGHDHRVQQYRFSEAAEGGGVADLPSSIWADAASGEIVAMRLAGILNIVQHGFDAATLPDWKADAKSPQQNSR